MERFTVAASTSSNGNTSLSQRPIIFKNNNNNISSFPPPKPLLRDTTTSFSSSSTYLKQQQPPLPKPIPPIQDRLTCRVVDDSAEISIFEAEKYFNETQDHQHHHHHQKENKKSLSLSSSSVTIGGGGGGGGLNLDPRIVLVDSSSSSIPRLSSVSSIDGYGRNYRTGSFHATPTASSEASWNSQSGLLSNPPGSIAVSMRNLRLDGAEKRKGGSPSPSSSSSNKWFFGRKCPCSGEKSVQVEEKKFSEPKSTPVLHLNSSSLNHRKQSLSDSGGGGGAGGGGGGGGEEFSVLSSSSSSSKAIQVPINGIDEIPPKLKPLVTSTTTTTTTAAAANWAKEKQLESVAGIRDSGGFSPENHFPADIGRRVVPSGRSFSDNGGGGGGAFSFPILNPPQVATKLLLSCPTKSLSQLEDPPRESLEVFRPTEESSLRKSTDIQRRVLMSFPEDNDRRSFTFPASPKTRITTPMEDDVVSDASSDLFEIESFSTQTTMYPMYRRRDSLDEISSYEAKRFGSLGGGILNFRRSLDETTTTASIAPTECYEPSEASIDWSVTTAEGFDRGSITNFSIAAASDYEENRSFMNTDSRNKVIISNNSSSKKKGGNGLLSCRCEKAVSVGPHPVKCIPEQQRHHHVGTPYGIESGRINPAGMSRLSDISSIHHITRASVGSSKLPLARSHSARMSHALTTH